MIRTKKFENLPQITSISPSGKIVVTENGVDKVISFEDFSNLPPATEVWDNASTTFTASEVNVTDIQSAADSKLLDLKVNTVSKFVVRKDGNLGIGVANPAARLDISDTVLAGAGSLDGSVLNLAQTWDTTGNPTAIKLNVTNTASGATSNLLDLQVGGSNRFRVDKDGVTTIFGTFNTCTLKITQIGSNQTNGFGPFGGNAILAYANGARTMLLGYGGGYTDLRITAAHRFGWTSDAFSAAADLDTILVRDAANTLALRNGVNPQTFRLYNTYTNATTFERLNIKWDTNVLKIGTEKGASGGTARSMEFQTDAVTRITIKEDGNVGIGTTNPLHPLHISGNTNGVVRVRVENTGPAVFQAIAGTSKVASFSVFNGVVWDAGVDTDQKFKIAGPNGDVAMLSTNTRLAIDSSGNVGIGTSSPIAKLHIQEGNFVLNSGNYGSNYLQVGDSTGNHNLRILPASYIQTIRTSGSNSLSFETSGQAISRLFIDTVGNIGIGIITLSSKLDILDTTLAGSGSLAGSILNLAQTWNTTGAPTAIKLNVTNTASGATSNLLDLQVGGSSKFRVAKDGRTFGGISSDSDNGYYRTVSAIKHFQGYFAGATNGSLGAACGASWVIRGTGDLAWSDSSQATSCVDLRLFRDAANILAQRNGVNPQTFRLYGTYTDASNYARLAISCDTSGNAILATEGLGTGAAGTISIGNAKKIILGTSAGVDLAFRTTDSTSVGFRIGASNTLEIVRSDAGAYANLMLNNITVQGTLSTLYAPINSNVNVAGTTGEHVALIASSSSNGTAANGFGTRIVLRTESSTTAARDSGAISALWSDATDATRTSDLLFYNALNGTLTERMRILGSNGNVGIGTATPTTPLSIQSNSAGSAFNILGMAGNFLFQVGGVYGVNLSSQGNTSTDGFLIGTDVNSSNAGSMLRFQTKGSTRLVVDYLGNVGIGTTTPLNTLHIYSASSEFARFERNSPSGTGSIGVYQSGSNRLILGYNSDVGNGQANGGIASAGVIRGDAGLHLVSGSSALGGITVATSGNVGIGIITPAARLDISDTTLAGSGSLAGSALNISQTWNTTGSPSLIYGRVTNTASGATSNLINLGTVAGGTLFKVTKGGNISFGHSEGFSQGFEPFSNTAFNIRCYGTTIGGFASTDQPQGLHLNSSSSVVWTNASGGIGSFASVDLYLLRDTAGTLAQRNGVNPQTFRLYNTYTNATTFERLNIKWDTNVLKIGTEKGSSGGTARAMEFQTDGTSRWSISTDGHLIPAAGNTYNIGASGGNSPSNIYVSNNVIVGANLFTGSIVAPGVLGSIKLIDSNGNNFGRLQFGGTTSSFPSIKRNGAGLDCRLADDSADAWFAAGQLTSSGGNVYVGDTRISRRAQGVLMMEYSGTFDRLQFGGTTSSFPAIKRNGAGIQIRLADDSANTTLEAGNIYATGNVGIGTTAPSTFLEIAIPTTGNYYGQGIKLSRGSGYFTIGNGTGTNNFVPIFTGKGTFTGDATAMNFVGLTGDDSDTVSGVINFSARNSSGTGGISSTQKAFTFLNYTTELLSILATGSVGISKNTPAAKLDIEDTTLAGSGSLAGSILNLAQTWNTTGAPTAIKLNVTNTASGAASNLLDLQVDTVSKFAITKGGQIIGSAGTALLPTYSFFDSNWGTGYIGWFKTADMVACSAAGGTVTPFSISHIGLKIQNSIPIGWTSGTGVGTLDTILIRDGAANTLAMRNGVNAQEFRLYNTYTDANTFERLNIKWDANVLKIGTEKGSVGGTVRNLEMDFPILFLSKPISLGDTRTVYQSHFNSASLIGSFFEVTSFTNIIRLNANTTDGQNIFFRFGNNDLGSKIGNGSADGRQLVFNNLNTTSGSMTWVMGSTEAIRLTQDGKVGIGSTTPPAHLTVTSAGTGYEGTQVSVYGSAQTGGTFVDKAGNTVMAATVAVGGNGSGLDPTFNVYTGNNLSRLLVTAGGNVGIGTTSPTEKLDVAGNLKVSGHFSATTKSFLIPHPTKPDKKLQYACLEGPENGVYIRGKTNEPIILLPDYWSELVDADSITVTVTPIGKPQQLFVVSQNSTSVEIGNVDGLYNYLIFAERKDVNKLQTEI